MEKDKSKDKLKNNNSSLHKRDQESQRGIKKSPNKYKKYVKTNLYLNEYNYYFKNAIKMNKIREEKFKEYKLKIENARKNNILPKMLYFNKFLNNDTKKSSQKKNIYNQKELININKFNKSNLNTECITSENRPLAYKKIEKAIIAKNIEEHNKSHIKKTFKAFDDLIKYVDNFRFQKRRSNSNLIITENNEKNISDVFDDNEKENNSENEEVTNIENYNYDEFKQKYQDAKINSNSQENLKTFNNERIDNNYSENFKILEEKNNDSSNIYITASSFLKKNKAKDEIINNKNNYKILEKSEKSNSFVNKNKKNPEKKKLFINNMTIIR